MALVNATKYSHAFPSLHLLPHLVTAKIHSNQGIARIRSIGSPVGGLMDSASSLPPDDRTNPEDARPLPTTTQGQDPPSRASKSPRAQILPHVRLSCKCLTRNSNYGPVSTARVSTGSAQRADEAPLVSRLAETATHAQLGFEIAALHRFTPSDCLQS